MNRSDPGLTGDASMMILACILLIAAIGVTGCTDAGTTPVSAPATPSVTISPTGTPPAQASAGILTVDMGAHRKTIPTRPGEPVRVRLPEDPSTGYTWTSSADAGIAVGAEWFEPPGMGAAGTGGFHVWDLRGIAGGPQTFTAVYARPPEPDTRNETTFTLTLLVAGTDGRIVTEKENGATVPMRMGAPFALILHENPATGYVWDMGMSSGLTVTADRFFPGQLHGPAGAGGMHEWDVKITGAGNQTIYGVYKRPDETTTGTEDTFMLTIAVR